MAKQKTVFLCSSCGNETAKWFGCCPACKEWNTIEEARGLGASSTGSVLKKGGARTLELSALSSIAVEARERLVTGIEEWDRVMGGGIMPGSFIILTGDPGIGKSTLLLRVASTLSKRYRTFYFSSEESLEQVKVRAERIACLDDRLLFSDHADLDDIIATVEREKPDLIVLDSIQNCYSGSIDAAPGSIGQLREAAFRLMRLAKDHHVAVILSGHITKEGLMAGPKTLEHMVDAAFYLQGEDRWQTRILRSIKNRFGTVNELGFFEMGEQGLIELPNINQLLLDELSQTPGAALVSCIEGSRPLLLELQALTIASQYGIPQRVISGVDPKQVVLIAAILEKYLHVKLSSHDIFFKISGNMKVKGSATDLGIALALLSSYFQQPLPSKAVAIAEISLTGQIKPINYIGLHVKEAEKFGLEKLFVARNQKIDKTSCSLHRFKTVGELVALFE